MPTLNLARHEKYWRRCLKTFLPTQYTSNDASRMTFGCFSLSALDILGKLDESINEEERNDFIEWIYLCQHPKGGFRGFTGTNFEAHALRTIENDEWDPANIAGTYFALASLLTLGDDLSRVKRRECLMWLKKLQVKDGSFGEVLGANDVPSAGQDVRYCFLAALVRWILREPGNTENDFDVEALKAFILQSVSHEGGVGRAPFHEAHAGWTYCGIGTLSLIKEYSEVPGRPSSKDIEALSGDVIVQDILHWLVSRQTSLLKEESEGEGEEEDGESEPEGPIGHHHNHHQSTNVKQFGNLLPIPPVLEAEALPLDFDCAGFNGRCNKPADTCYSFWVGASLGMLKQIHLHNFNSNRKYLLEKTQHIVGGFSKLPGDPPDILHSYLGLAALSIMGEEGLQSLDPLTCMSLRAREHLEQLPWRRLQ